MIEEKTPFDSLGAVLSQRRKDLRLTLEQASDLSGCSIGFIHQAEHGKASLRLDTLLRLMKTLGLQFVVTNGQEEISIDDELGR